MPSSKRHAAPHHAGLDDAALRLGGHDGPGPCGRPLAAPRIGVGCILLRGDEILLVRERGRWSLPKGGLESGELVQDGARRDRGEGRAEEVVV